MRYLLARDNQEVLVQLAASRVLLVFDFDGTLAPIVACRDEAGMRPETGYLLTKVCGLYPSAIISGRSRRDVTNKGNALANLRDFLRHQLEIDRLLARLVTLREGHSMS